MSEFYKLLGVRLLINLADSLFYITTLWYVADNFSSSLATGVIVALFTVPEILQIFIGPLVDRFTSKRLLLAAVVMQFGFLGLLFVTWRLKSLAIMGTIVLFSSLASAVTYPLEDVMIPQIVPQQRIVFANSLFSISSSALDTLFNAISGFLLSMFSYITLYHYDFALYGLVLIPLFMLKASRKKTDHAAHLTNDQGVEPFTIKQYMKDMKEGITFMRQSPLLINLSLPLIVINFFNSINAVALPYYAKTFTNSALSYGFLMAGIGIGNVIGGVLVNPISHRVSAGKIVASFLCLNGTLWLTGIFMHSVWGTPFLILLSSIASGIFNVIYSGLYQTLPPVRILGRTNTTVDSLITLAMPLGGLLGGTILQILSPTNTLLLFGVCTALSGLVYFSIPMIVELPPIDKIKRLE